MDPKKHYLMCEWCHVKTCIETPGNNVKDLWLAMLEGGWWYRTDPSDGQQKPTCPECRARFKTMEGGGK